MAPARELRSLVAASSPARALAGCAVSRALDGQLEIVTASIDRRSFAPRVSEGLGICLKTGAAHEVVADGRRVRYPADALCIRAPGSVWSTADTGPAGFLSIDVYGAGLPSGLSAFPMTFLRSGALPLRSFVRTLQASTVGAEQLLVDLLSRLGEAGVIVAGELRVDAPTRCAQRARDRLETELCSPPTLGELAEAVGANRFALLRSFRRAFGVTPHAFLMTLRIERARSRIARGAELIEIAHELGFADQPHFTRVFKRIVGVTPGHYARRVRAISFKTGPQPGNKS
ncbi:MAG: sle [Myxococcaceae bacterium]|nr:sle [Myxococcaceae bacterium]